MLGARYLLPLDGAFGLERQLRIANHDPSHSGTLG